MYSNQQSIYLDAWNLSRTMSNRKQYISFWFWPRINPPYIVHTISFQPRSPSSQLVEFSRCWMEWHSHVRITSVVYIMSDILYPMTSWKSMKILSNFSWYTLNPSPKPMMEPRNWWLVNNVPFPWGVLFLWHFQVKDEVSNVQPI